jgi:integral membrane protein (TIGR00529 family)
MLINYLQFHMYSCDRQTVSKAGYMDILKITIVFVLIMLFLSKKAPIIFVMPAASVLLAVLFTIPALEFIKAYALALISPDTLKLLLTMYLIMLLEELMVKRGYMKRLLSSMDDLFHSKRLNISLLPMLIGFLPSAGGALFSAPMVEKAAEGTALTPEDKTFLNTMYRHVMELFFPTYPCLIMASQLAALPFSRLIPALFPIAVIVFMLGQWHLRKLPLHLPYPQTGRGKMAVALLLALWPLLTLILLILVFHMPVYFATAIILTALILAERLPLRDLPRLLKESTNVRMLLMVLVVMAFKDTLMLCGVMDTLPKAIGNLPIPSFLIFSLMTLFISVITGMTFTSVGIVLPLALVGVEGTLPIAVLILLSAYCGVMITPMHLCITLVAEHFKADLRRVLALSLPTYFVLYMLSIGLFLLLNLL